MIDLAERADRFFLLSEAADTAGLAAMCADGCRVKQNIGEETDVAGLTALVDGFAAAGVTVTYSDVRRVVAPSAVTEQHLVTLRRADGVEVAADACVILRFDDDGMIVELDEYVDAASFAAIFD